MLFSINRKEQTEQTKNKRRNYKRRRNTLLTECHFVLAAIDPLELFSEKVW
jgi:hypothetical protein